MGFYYGADLDDSNQLEGTGKKLRHIKIKKPDEINNPEIKYLLQRASQYLPKIKRAHGFDTGVTCQ